MALLLIEGFDQYDTDAQLTRGGWTSIALTSTVNLLSGADTRFNQGQCIELVGNGIPVVIGHAPVNDFTCGMAVNFADAMATADFARFRNGLIDHLVLSTTGSGELLLERGTTQLAITSGLGLNAGQWYYIEINANIHNSTGDYDVHVDGSSVFSDTGVDTQNGGSAVVDNIEIQGNSTQDTRWDDIYFLDDSGSDNVGLLGDCRVETLFPDSDGNETDFTPLSSTNVSNVDDGLSPDDDTTYNSSATVTDRDLYGFAALTGSVGTVFGVDAKMIVRKEDAGFREVRVIARSNVTEVESADFTLGANYTILNHIFENDPDGGTDWDEAAVNAAEFGIDLST